jgi:hypothetical protein
LGDDVTSIPGGIPMYGSDIIPYLRISFLYSDEPDPDSAKVLDSDSMNPDPPH